MKNLRKRSILVLILAFVAVFCAFGLTACGDDSGKADNRDKNIVDIYNVYVTYSEENGTTPLSYEEWLKSIKGAKGENGKDGTNGKDGKDGETPYIGENGNWWIGSTDTGVAAKGDKGQDGKDGTNGKDGKDGENGKDGNGIKTIIINGNGELIITLDDGTVVNAGQVVAPIKRLDENNQITCKTFEKSDKTIYGKVSNDTDVFYFIDEIEIKGAASYRVYKDFECKEEIISKTVRPEVGNNTFYLLEECGSDSKFYTVTVRRKPIYTLTFDSNGGSVIENNTIEVEEDCVLNEEELNITKPERVGYGLGWWDYDFTKPITENLTVKAIWKAIYTLNGNSITGLTDYGKTLTELNIPSKIDNVEIKTIGASCFEDNAILTAVTIPDSVTSIGESVFYNCSSLTSITIGNSVTSIVYAAFYNCSSLTSITIPDSVTSIGGGAFGSCSSLTSITIPDSVTSIGRGAFGDCSSLTSITIPDSVTSIGSDVFYNCSSLTSITIPDSVTSIGSNAFSLCSSLTSITIPDSVTSIGYLAFQSCTSLKDITFTGTMGQWNSISKVSGWNYNTGDYTVHCTDGDIKK